MKKKSAAFWEAGLKPFPKDSPIGQPNPTQPTEAQGDVPAIMKMWRRVLDKCLEEEMNMPAEDTQEGPGRILILRCLMPQLEVLLLDKLAALKASQQAEIEAARVAMMEACLDKVHCNCASRPCPHYLIRRDISALVPTDVQRRTESAHLAELAKVRDEYEADLTNQRECHKCTVDALVKCVEKAESSNLAALAKVIRQCAAHRMMYIGRCMACDCGWAASEKITRAFADQWTDHILALLTPVMLEAEAEASASASPSTK